MKTKFNQFINELNQSTYYSAAKLAGERGHKKTSDRFRDHASDMLVKSNESYGKFDFEEVRGDKYTYTGKIGKYGRKEKIKSEENSPFTFPSSNFWIVDSGMMIDNIMEGCLEDGGNLWISPIFKTGKEHDKQTIIPFAMVFNFAENSLNLETFDTLVFDLGNEYYQTEKVIHFSNRSSANRFKKLFAPGEIVERELMEISKHEDACSKIKEDLGMELEVMIESIQKIMRQEPLGTFYRD